MEDKVLWGSETAKGGFRNEDDVIDKFNNWKNDILSTLKCGVSNVTSEGIQHCV